MRTKKMLKQFFLLMTKIIEQLSTPLVSPLENQIKIIEGQFLICRSVQMHEHNLLLIVHYVLFIEFSPQNSLSSYLDK